MLWSSFLLALREIRRNLLRSFLTILGIVIGVSAVITMVTLGNGATQAVKNQVSSLGSNLLQIRNGQRMMGPPGGGGGGGSPPFSLEDVAAIRSQITGLAAVAPEVSKSATVVSMSNNWSTSVTGSTNDFFIAGSWKLAAGRTFSEAEEKAGQTVCLIGETIRRELFGTQQPVGESLRVNNFSCEIIGILVSKGQASMGRDQDDTVIMPIKAVQRRLTGNQNVSSIQVSVADENDITSVKEQASDDHLTGSGGVGQLTGGRDWHYEYYAGVRDRTYPRNRYPAGDWGVGTRSVAAIFDRGGGAGFPWRFGRDWVGNVGIHRLVAGDECAVYLQRGNQPAVVCVFGGDWRVVWVYACETGRKARPD